MKSRITWILIIGGLACSAALLFRMHVAGLDALGDTRTPLSWGFKSQAVSLPEFFRSDQTMADKNASPARPKIDLQRPEQTEHALFALG